MVSLGFQRRPRPPLNGSSEGADGNLTVPGVQRVFHRWRELH